MNPGQINRVDLVVNGQSQTLVDAISYAPFGPMTGLTYGNGLTLTRVFDTAYRLTAQSTPGVLERTYPNYDANGNRLNQTDTLPVRALLTTTR